MNVAVNSIPLQKISDPEIEPFGINLFVLRLDLIHPTISGNKWFKLKYNLKKAAKQNKKTLLTFGGAYSNHIAATAAAGKELGFKTIGIIRGEKNDNLNSTLQLAIANGMTLKFVSREEYRLKSTIDFIDDLKSHFDDFYLLPEGGTNDLAIKGCSEILSHLTIPFDNVCCAAGTGGTLAGIISTMDEKQKALGFQVLKGAGYLKSEIDGYLKRNTCNSLNNWDVNEQYHFGGYAKVNKQLLDFMAKFRQQHNIPLDYVYTAKMMYGVYDLISKGFFKKDTTIIAIHTGGLQGNVNFNL